MRKIKKILITGAAGYIGGHLIKAATAFFPVAEVTASDIKKPADNGRFRFVKCDVSDAKAAAALVKSVSPDVIINLAGTGSATILPWDTLVRANLMTSVSLMEAAAGLEGKPPLVILVGSAAEYGFLNKSQLPAKESLRLKPASSYGLVKSWQSAAAGHYRAARGLDVIVARMFNVIGPQMSENLSVGSFAAQVSRIESKEREPVISVGDISAKRDFVDVRDVAEALCLIAAKGKSGDTYNVASGKSVPLERIVKILCSSCRVKIKIAREAARLRANDVKDIRGSSSALRKRTGWKPRYTLVETLGYIRRGLP